MHMKTYLVFGLLCISSVTFADVPSLKQARECIMDLAGDHPELRSCRGNGIRSEPKDNEDIEKCEPNGDTGKCLVYVKCPLGDGTAQRYKIEAQVNYRGW